MLVGNYSGEQVIVVVVVVIVVVLVVVIVVVLVELRQLSNCEVKS